MTIFNAVRQRAPTLLAAGLCAIAASAHAESTINVAGFGGFVLDSEIKYLFAPAEKLGIKAVGVRNGAWGGVKAHLTAGAPGWDIISIGMARCEQAVQGGYVLPIDYSIVDKSRIPANLATPNYVGVFTFSYGIAYQKAKYGANPPKSWADFWDVKKFPGRRSLEVLGTYALEAAIMADGVPTKDTYNALRAPGGIDRALKKIKELQPAIAVWWSNTGQVMQLVKDGEVDMALISNGRVAQLVKNGANLGFVWNQAIVDVNCYMVPKTAANPKAAMQALNVVFDPEGQANLANATGYGPVNPKSFEIGVIKKEELEWLPTEPKNLAVQLYLDPKWYASPDAIKVYENFSKLVQ
jgi:putative spermidine/putrescine transport system substrate-binding protein